MVRTVLVVMFPCCVPVPGGSDGPSGVLICSENYITYKNFGDQPDIRCPIPRRRVRILGFLLYLFIRFSLLLLSEFASIAEDLK